MAKAEPSNCTNTHERTWRDYTKIWRDYGAITRIAPIFMARLSRGRAPTPDSSAREIPPRRPIRRPGDDAPTPVSAPTIIPIVGAALVAAQVFTPTPDSCAREIPPRRRIHAIALPKQCNRITIQENDHV